MSTFDLSLGLQGTNVVVTGGCGLIGRVVVDAFLAAGCKVFVLDFSPTSKDNQPFQTMMATHEDQLQLISTDITREQQLDDAFAKIESEHGPVQCCVALASLDLSVLPQTDSICDAQSQDWQRVFDVNIHGTFNTARRWLQGIRKHTSTHSDQFRNVSLILMGSESGKFGVRGCAAYAAAKSAVQYGLLQSLAKDAPRIFRNARVNAVAPGAVDTTRFRDECQKFGKEWKWEECQATVPMAKSVPAEDVARTIVFLASEKWSGTTHGQVLHVDGGKTGSVAWRLGEFDSSAS